MSQDDAQRTAATMAAPDREPDAGEAPPEGQVMAGLERYVDLGRIGAGGMGEVRRVHDRLLGRVLAMKLLSWRLADDRQAQERFLHEARVTSALQHPAIVAVHDVGVLPDGRPWYTMREVRGETFGALIRALHATEGGEEQRLAQLVQVLIRACEALAHAHESGVVHCDLKPANLMVGRFGEVQVMDWGVARRLDETLPQTLAHPLSPLSLEGEMAEGTDAKRHKVAGTLPYMSPEQARGHALSPAGDVYALGAVLYETMTGAAPLSGSWRQIWSALLAEGPAALATLPPHPLRPDTLCAIGDRAMRRDPAARYQDAGELADALRAWLDTRTRRARAMAILQRADRAWPEIARLRERARSAREAAAEQLETVKPYDPIERKRPAWQLQARATAHEREAAVKEAEWQQIVRSALNEVPDFEGAHQRLADYYRERLEAAEAAHDHDGAARSEALLRAHDRGGHSAYLRGDSTLTLHTDPPDARLTIHRFVLCDRRLITEPVADDAAPLNDYVLSAGSYLIVAEADGRHPVRYPVRLLRGGRWDSRRPGDDAPTSLWLPPLGTLDVDDIYIPAGWCQVGGDPAAIEPLPHKRVWLDGFIMRRFPITCSEYLAFLNALVDTGQPQQALQRAPKKPLYQSTGGTAEPLWHPDVNGRYRLESEADPQQLHRPVGLIDWYDAYAYADWMAAHTSRPWRLPSELEWEKAARGVDGRFLPWGDDLEPTYACVVDSHDGELGAQPVDSFPTDESPYGVRGVAGNVRDWCVDRWERNGPLLQSEVLIPGPADLQDSGYRVARGGAWTLVAERAQLASRFAGKPTDRYRGLGFRLVCSLPAPDR